MRFTALDSIRGVCAILVCLFHLPLAFYLSDAAFLRHSYLFVDFFFVLSGFVICHAYGDRLSLYRVPSFLLRRFGRLWPLHVTVLSFLLVLQLGVWVLHGYGLSAGHAAFEGRFDIAALVLDLLFLNSFGLLAEVTWNGPAWSIGAEFWTYLLFAAVTVIAAARMVWGAALFSLTALLALAVFSPQFMAATHDFGLVRCVAGFFAGVCTYHLWRQYLAERTLWRGAEWLATIAAVTFVVLCGRTAWSLAAPLIFGMVILVFAAQSGRLSRVLLTAPFRAAGRWSYSIYMVHSAVIFVFINAARLADALGMPSVLLGASDAQVIDISSGGGAWLNELAMLAFLAIVMGVSALTYRFIETPARKRFNAIADQWDEGVPRQGFSHPAPLLPPASPAGR